VYINLTHTYKIKSIGEVIQKADNIDLYRKLLDLQAEAITVLEKLSELKKENKGLKEKLETGKLTFKDKMYFLKGDKNPFCSKCWDVDGKLIRLHGDGEGWFQCPACKTVVHEEYNRSYNSQGSQLDWL
jgi:hypothetical protein